MKHLISVGSMKKSWPIWQPIIHNHLTQPDPTQAIFDLGDKLSDVFKLNSTGVRTQSAVSGGGAAWECVVTWYLNFIFFGTDIIATRQKKDFVPSVISDALTVTISNHQTNTESDIVIYKVPNASEMQAPSLKEIDRLIRKYPKLTDVGVVQCKTNWNDNAQIPMLWDLIYNASSFKIPNVSIGSKGMSPSSFNAFSYAFMTVPTVQKDPTSKSLAALRVNNLTGGNFWGKANKPGVALSINEYFTKNFSKEFNGGVVNHLRNSVMLNPKQIFAFTNLDFDSL